MPIAHFHKATDPPPMTRSTSTPMPLSSWKSRQNHKSGCVMPNVPHATTFWAIHFRDESELCVVHPLPAEL